MVDMRNSLRACIRDSLLAILIGLGAQTGLAEQGKSTDSSNVPASIPASLPSSYPSDLVRAWTETQELHEQGKLAEAMQRAQMIVDKRPDSPDAWDYIAWNWAFNIPAKCKTPEEKWNAVRRGVEILRDQAIPANPKSAKLYRSLFWILAFKMGNEQDEMQMSCVEGWASMMQRVLGAPPDGKTELVISAFEPVAKAPLDRTLPPDASHAIQQEQLKGLLKDGQISEYAGMLEKKGIPIGQELLDAYNRLSTEPLAAAVRIRVPKAASEDGRQLQALLSDDQYKDVRSRLLGFVRAQILWNVYRMDPQRMLRLMKEHDVPLDWRTPLAHGLYWESVGLEIPPHESIDIGTITSHRALIFVWREQTLSGRLTLIENEEKGGACSVYLNPDLRYVNAWLQQSSRYLKLLQTSSQPDIDPVSRDAYVKQLDNMIVMLCASGQDEQAGTILKCLQDLKEPKAVKAKDALAYVIDGMDSHLAPYRGTFVTTALRTGFLAASCDDTKTFEKLRPLAKQVFDLIKPPSDKALKLSFDQVSATMLTQILVEPREIGCHVSIADRSKLWRHMLAKWPGAASVAVYENIRPILAERCKKLNVDFPKAFPRPAE